MEKLTQQDVELVVRTMADVALANEKYFSDLDAVMGDADFGTSLADGYRALTAGWEKLDRSSISSFLLSVATIIVSKTGGSSGPVWGTLFMRCGAVAKGKAELALPDIIAMLESAMQGITARGGAVPGDKTLLDALDAIVKSLRQSQSNNVDSLLTAFDAAAEAAYETRETTKGWIAKRGRQSFTGERSRGTYDPGIIAMGDMAKAIAKALNERA